MEKEEKLEAGRIEGHEEKERKITDKEKEKKKQEKKTKKQETGQIKRHGQTARKNK